MMSFRVLKWSFGVLKVGAGAPSRANAKVRRLILIAAFSAGISILINLTSHLKSVTEKQQQQDP